MTAQKRESPAGTGQIAEQITTTPILPSAEKIGKSAMLSVEHGGFLAEIGGASWN
jgi:hypothetical protein